MPVAHSSVHEMQSGESFGEFRDFLGSTTLHGARFLEAKHLIRRLVWMILLCVAFGGCAYQVLESFTAFYNWPISTVITTKHKKDLPFPAITICNFNIISKSRYIEAERENYAKKMNLRLPEDKEKIDEALETEVEKLIYLFSAKMSASERSRRLGELFKDRFEFKEQGSELEKALRGYSQTIEQALSIKWLNPCEWQLKSCDARNFSLVIDLRMGRCSTFNSAKGSSERLNVKMEGPNNALSLRLHVMDADYVRNFYSKMAGFKVIVHDPNEYPALETSGFAVQPGSHTYCAVKMKKYVNLQSPYETNCASNKTDINRFFNVNYSMSTCSRQCLHNYGIKKCGCQPIYNITKGVPLCSLKDTFECIYPAFYGTFPEEAAECFRKYCPVPCEQTKYETKLSYATAISNAFARRVPTHGAGHDAESFQEINNLTEEQKKEYFRDNIATLDVYFEELSYDLIEQKGTFDSWSLVANIGGYLGLFLGMSILTVAEFLDLLVIKLIRSIKGVNERKVAHINVQ